jgi:hypothetical protein
MPSRILTGSVLLLLAAAVASCTNRPMVELGTGAFRVSFAGNPELGSEQKPIPFSAEQSREFLVDIDALAYRDGAWVVDEGFNGNVVVSVRPTGKLHEEPLSVRLVGGRARGVKVGILMAYGPVRLVVTDSGYVPAVDLKNAACNNSVDENQDGFIDRFSDDDGDGFVDFLDDRGCYSPGDDSEEGGSGGAGVSPLITFANPRIADIQTPGKAGDRSALEKLRVTVDQGFLLISRVSTDGLYLTDYDGARWDPAARLWQVDVNKMHYRSIFAFNFSTPINIQEGDCLVQIDGTVQEFYNYTELGMPTWKKGDYPFCATLAQQAGMTSVCNPKDTDEAKISACRQELEALSNTPFDLTKLKVDLPSGVSVSVWSREGGLQAERFESALVQLSDVEMFTEVRTCDRNGNGVVDFGVKEEADCSNDCGDDPGCIIAETYNRYQQWSVHFQDGGDPPETREVTVVSQGAIPKFNPMAAYQAYRGGTPKKLGRIVGTMRHLSFGRPPWTLELRRPSDCPDCAN